MTGGLAWVYDEEGKFMANGLYHRGFLQPQTWDELDSDAQNSIRVLVEAHQSRTGSKRAQSLLHNWNRECVKFVRLTPRPQH